MTGQGLYTKYAVEEKYKLMFERPEQVSFELICGI